MSDKLATRKAYGEALVEIGESMPEVVVLDGETSNSTYSKKFHEKFPERFIESFIAEQNMAGMALGLARAGKIPFASTFGAFWTRAHDQIRMTAYSEGNVKFVGSHAGVSIGEDGSSQMALEDLALFRSVWNSTVLYPADAVAARKLTWQMAWTEGLQYLRTSRPDTEQIYEEEEEFPIGSSKTLESSKSDEVTVMGAGITLYEVKKAYQELQKQNINIRVIDLYSVKPVDVETLVKAAEETKAMVVVEDHYPEGGIFEAVSGELSQYFAARKQSVPTILKSLAVTQMPRSGTKEELLAYEEIDSQAVVKTVKELVG
jgi:transketolase